MKKFYIVAGIALVLFSCATKQVNFDQLQDRHGLFYLANSDRPFNGEIISYSAGKVEFEGMVKNGLRDGQWTYYYPSGQKKSEGGYLEGLKEGTWTYWLENGVQANVELYKMGNKLGNEVTEPADSMSMETTAAPAAPVSKTTKTAVKSEETKPQPAEKTGVEEPKKPKPVVWEELRGGPVKFYDGVPYTGPVVKYFRNGNLELEGNFTNGKRTGKWIFYFPTGTVKSTKYY
jgi:uncharacterized protein